MISCYASFSDNDISNMYTNNLAGCIAYCAGINGCNAVVWVVGSPQGPCYAKSLAVFPAAYNINDYAAYLVSSGANSSTSSGT